MATVLSVLQWLISISLIVVVLLQPSAGEGLGSIGGGAQLFSRKKGSAEILEKATKVLAVCFMGLSVVMAVFL